MQAAAAQKESVVVQKLRLAVVQTMGWQSCGSIALILQWNAL